MGHNGRPNRDAILELDRSPRAGRSAAIRATVPTRIALFARTAWLQHQPTVLIWLPMNLATSAVGLHAVYLMERHAQPTLLIAKRIGKPATATLTVVEANTAQNRHPTVTKKVSVSVGQIPALLATNPYAAAMVTRTQTHAWLPQMGGRVSCIPAHVTTRVGATATVIAKVMSTVTFQTKLAATTLGENVRPFPLDRTVMALQILQCAAVMT
mmetsp:Transcript_1859/g.2982  ORF Transcript_1859/g.2982 Transcript_1859/m.2982 type:complete len:212 (-) Transcript_1859:213-848(-)